MKKAAYTEDTKDTAIEEAVATEGAMPTDGPIDAVEGEPVEGIGLEDAVAAEGDAEEAPPKKRRRWPVVIGITAVVVVAIVGLGFVFAAPSDDAPQQQGAEAAAASQESSIKATVTAEGAVAGDLKVKVTDKDNKEVIKETTLAAGQAKTIGTLSQGTYQLYVTSVPVCLDGSTFAVPDKATAVTVKGDGQAVDAKVALSKLPTGQMTKEQLLASADALEGAGHAAEAAAVREAAQAAPDAADGSNAAADGQDNGAAATPDPGAGTSNGSTGGGSTGNTGGSVPSTPPSQGSGNSGNTGGGSSGGSTGGGNAAPAPTPAPAPRYVVDQPAWDEWVVDVPAQPAVAEQGHWVPYWITGGQKFYNYEEARAYSLANKVSIGTYKEWVVDVPAKAAIPEQGHWVHHAEVGHWE